MSYKIESHLPIPNFRGRPLKYPFEQMKVNDSFLLNGDNPANVTAAGKAFGDKKSPKWKFGCRKTPEGHRCWRVD